MKRTGVAVVFLIAGCVPALARADSAPSSSPPQALAEQVKRVFAANCYRCHGENGAAEGKMAYVTDLAALARKQKVLPRDPLNSKLYKRLVSADDPMPPLADEDDKPVTRRPSQAEIALVRQWIEAGAPADAAAAVASARAPVSEADVLAAIDRDLSRADDRAQPFLRYFTITHLYNAGLGDDELQTFRGGLSKLVNSLSWGRQVVVPAPIDAARAIFRIDLRDYKWNEHTWARILAADPYGVTYSTPTARDVYARTRCALPYVRADWFVFAASRPPLYHDVLELPDGDAELERILKVDVAEDIRTERVARAGFNGSGVASNNRIIQREDSPYGAYWKSYDFRKPGADDRKNVFAHPLGPGPEPGFFEQDGGEIIFNLPNGLQAYMLVNGEGRRIDKGPADVVSDPKQADRAVVNGVSCMSCHVNGMIGKTDQVRDTVLNNPAGYDANTAALVKALYPPRATLDALLKDDAGRFLAAVARTQAARTRSEPIVSLSLQFQSDLDASLAAAEAGVTPQRLREVVARSPALASRLGALNIPGGTVQRDVFVAVFGELVRTIGPGTFLPPTGDSPVAGAGTGGHDPSASAGPVGTMPPPAAPRATTTPPPSGAPPYAPAGDDVAFTPPNLPNGRLEIGLPAPADGTLVGGGGRYLLAHLKKLRQLAVLDVGQAKVIKYLPLPSSDVLFAAGLGKLYIAYKDLRQVQRWDLARLQMELTVAAPEGGVEAIATSPGADGPLLLVGQKRFWILDPASLKATRFPSKNWGTDGSAWGPTRVHVSFDGSTVVACGGGWAGIELSNLAGSRVANQEAGGFVNGDTLVAGNGSLVYPDKGGILRSDLKSKVTAIEGEPFPADDPAFSLAVRQNKDRRKGRSAASGGLVIFANADPRPLITLRNLDELTKDSKLRWEERVHLIPRGKVLITVGDGGDRLILRPFDLARRLDEEGVDYLFVESAPASAATCGARFTYRMRVRSKRGGVKAQLQSGPPGMTISPDGLLTWQVPAHPPEAQVTVIVQVSDDSGQTTFHSFSLLLSETAGRR